MHPLLSKIETSHDLHDMTVDQLEQVAIDWQESPGSTVKISSAFRMAASLLVIRLRLFLGNNN